MIWEPGKTYTTRNGRNATVWEIARGEEFPVIGAYTAEDGERYPAAWTRDGSYFGDIESGRDLMPPEPRKRTVWVNLYGEFDGNVRCGNLAYPSKGSAEMQPTSAPLGLPYLGAFPVKIVEK